MSAIRNEEQYARINPDSKPVLYLVLTVTTVIAAVALTVSFAGLAAVSEWAQVPPRLSWALPVFIDGAILGFTIMILVFRARGESTVFAWFVLVAFTIISVGANGAHAYAEGVPEDWRTVVGSGLAGLAPAGLAVFIHGIARLLVAPPQRDVRAQEPAVVARLVKADEMSLPDAVENDQDGGVPTLSEAENGAAEVNGDLRAAPLTLIRPGPVAASPKHAGAISSSSQNGLDRPVSQPLVVSGQSVRDSVSRPRPVGKAREALVARALELSADGWSQREISEELEVPQSTIGRWIRHH